LGKLKIIDLVKTFYKGDNQIKAIDHLSFEVDTGEFVSIVGRSGSGKSTLLNLIGGLDSASGGHIIFDDKDIAGWSRKELALHRRNHVGMIFQSFNLIFTRSALDNVILALTFGGTAKAKRKEKAIAVLSSVGLGERIYHLPDELSGGETQRVAIARALANNPDVILADEPTGNLDSVTADEIIEILVNLNRNKNKTILLVTHDQELAERVSDRVIRLLDGKIIIDKQINRTHENI